MLGTSVTTLDPWNDGVFALCPIGKALYVGGRFTHAGGKPVSNIARWDSAGTTDSHVVDDPHAPGGSRPFVDAAGPLAPGRARLHYGIPASGRTRLHIIDALGRVVDTPIDTHLEAGSRDLVWPPLDGHMAARPAGVYWARLEWRGMATARRFVLLN
jgi:hypothetical protein